MYGLYVALLLFGSATHSNSYGAWPVHLIITMIKWIRTSSLIYGLYVALLLFGCRNPTAVERMWHI